MKMLRTTLLLTLTSIVACGRPKSNPGPGDLLAPGAAGIIAVGLSVPVHDFTTLEIRAYPRFEPSAPYELPPDPSNSTYAAYIALSSVEFPYTYQIGADWVGTSAAQGWHILAWLSKTPLADAAVSGDWYGGADFELHDCSRYCDAACYCSLTEDVGFTIEEQVP